MAVNGIFRFHAVGQGLFYSGLIKSERTRHNGLFSFVYDCGSVSARYFLNREIDEFKALLPYIRMTKKKKLDMLIVSHLHDDHINGLEYLLNDVEVDTVVMPYTDSVIRLLARAESSSEEEFLNAFYTDPVGWFSSKGVHRILLVGSPSEGYYINKVSDEQMDQFYNTENDILHIETECIKTSERIADTDILYLNNNGRVISYSFCWIFQFNNLRLPETKSYVQVVERFQREEMMSLDEIFQDKILTKELARRIRQFLPAEKTVNRTSVVVVHEPLLYDGEKAIIRLLTSTWIDTTGRYKKFKKDSVYYQNEFSGERRGTILTGDIEIKEEEELPIGKDTELRFSVFQYPHHGAKKAIPNVLVPESTLSVFSVGIANHYGHPDTTILDKQLYSAIVNERASFDYIVTISG